MDFWPILYYITLLLIICKNVNRQSKLHLDDAKNKANVWISSTTVIPLWSELVAYFNEMHHYSLIFLPYYCFLYSIPLNLSISNKHAKKNLIMIPFWPLKVHIFYFQERYLEGKNVQFDVNITDYVKCLLSKCFSKKWT